MRKLLDVSGDSPSRQWFDAQGVTDPGINPKARAVSFEDATRGVTAGSKVRVGQDLPQLGNMNLEGGTAPQTQQDFITLENHIGKPAKGTFEGTGDATAASLATSPMASLFRYATQDDHDPLDWVNPSDTSQWTADDYDMIRKEGGRVVEQVPALGVLSNAYQVGYNVTGASATDSRKADQEYMTGVFNGLRGLVPNDRVTQKLLLMMMESQGVEIR